MIPKCQIFRFLYNLADHKQKKFHTVHKSTRISDFGEQQINVISNKQTPLLIHIVYMAMF